ncbi:hypothetical protein [Rhodovulum adriaticum]|uniref:EF-hand domain-containing protein n=1 Tax=Rhodovulum adriaticum TaxID=35804 RepID=A0A4R2NWH8_RHOAD|nr:hypothetical protein [Rhodovulum adriaticum]MBK1636233.1 hypothetical protein [Rhodovulum adriaticum]TCP26513.1 hypothetical protein EV656_102482 [Rhodovulum adriaticum]
MVRLTLTALALTLATGQAAPAQDRTAPHLMSLWDANRNGVVGFHELAYRQRAVFAHFDRNGDMLLDPTEAAHFDRVRALTGPLRGRNAAEWRRIVRNLRLMRSDIDGSGAVDLSEFRLVAAEWMAMLDRDADARLELSDVND